MFITSGGLIFYALTFPSHTQSLHALLVTTTYWTKADKQFALSIFLRNIGNTSTVPNTTPIRIVNTNSIITENLMIWEMSHFI